MLDAALELFVAQGYAATSTEQIARRAGLTKGALYFYFDDKLSLLLELLARCEAELYEPIFDRLQDSDASATEQMVMLTNWLAQKGAEAKEIPLLHVLVSLEFHGRDDDAAQRVQATYRRLHREIERVIRHGQDRGEFHRSITAADQAAVIVAMIDGMLLQWHRWGDRLDGAELARSARSLILDGIQVRNLAD